MSTSKKLPTIYGFNENAIAEIFQALLHPNPSTPEMKNLAELFINIHRKSKFALNRPSLEYNVN